MIDRCSGRLSASTAEIKRQTLNCKLHGTNERVPGGSYTVSRKNSYS